MNTWRAPERVVVADCADQIADLCRDLRSADTAPRLPAPVETEAASIQRTSVSGLKVIAAPSSDGRAVFTNRFLVGADAECPTDVGRETKPNGRIKKCNRTPLISYL
jgi:hypothetical protein